VCSQCSADSRIHACTYILPSLNFPLGIYLMHRNRIHRFQSFICSGSFPWEPLWAASNTYTANMNSSLLLITNTRTLTLKELHKKSHTVTFICFIAGMLNILTPSTLVYEAPLLESIYSTLTVLMSLGLNFN
jgi:hypothetical protein